MYRTFSVYAKTIPERKQNKTKHTRMPKRLCGSNFCKTILNLVCAMLLKVTLYTRGGTRIWKWRTSAYRRTKGRSIRCKISLKKGGHSVWAQKKKKKKMGSFLMWTNKNGGHLVCGNAISSQNLQIYIKITAKFVNFSKCARSAKICNLCVKFDTKVGQKGSLGVRSAGRKKGGLLTSTWYPPTYGSASPRDFMTVFDTPFEKCEHCETSFSSSWCHLSLLGVVLVETSFQSFTISVETSKLSLY